jgi:hypothetical protein
LDILDIYVYTDIAKNPPEIDGIPNYHHRKIDLKAEIEKMKTTNRFFYEFYQELFSILTTVKDLHFKIYSYETPNKIPLKNIFACIPFDFVIKEHKGEYRIFIIKNSCYSIFKNAQQFIDSHLDIPIKSINDIDPFDYIQNWKFQRLKNNHSDFTYKMSFNLITKIFLDSNPINYSDISMNDYEFDDNQTLKIQYEVLALNTNTNKQLGNYFKDEIRKSSNNFLQIDEMYDKFLISKDIKKELKTGNEEEDKKWDFTFEENKNFIKCKVDHEKQVNVLVENNFLINLEKATGLVLNCAKLFYSNKYPLIIIESKNGRGYNDLFTLMHQIFQLRIVDKTFYSFRITNVSKEYFNSSHYDLINPETCERIKTLDDIMPEVTDYYDYNNLKIEHKRTKVFDNAVMEFREALRGFREEYLNSPNLKKPTEIIIFTDSYS